MVRKLFSQLFNTKSSHPASSDEAPALPSALGQQIVNLAGARGIPSMPRTAQLAFQVATNPGAANEDFIKVLEGDEGLAARVLRVANSVYYERGQKSETIEQAVVVIGTSNLRSFLSASVLKDIFPGGHPYRAMLWQHDICVAIAARELARIVMPDRDDTAFLSGLMHDVGKLLLLQRFDEDYAQVLRKALQSEASLCTIEADTYVVDHTEIGQYIGEQWSFSSDIIAAIRHHHHAWDKVGQSLAAIVKGADILGHALGIGHLKEFHRQQEQAQAALPEMSKHFSMSDSQVRNLMEKTSRQYEEESSQYMQSG